MPQEHKKHRDVIAAIESVSAISDLTAKTNGHYDYEIDLEVVVYGRNYNGKQVGPYVRLLNYAPGEVIVREGEWGGNIFYILVAGKAEVWVKNENGYTKVSEIQAGTQFGEMSVLAGVPRAATVRAPIDQAIQVLEIQRPALRLLRKIPTFAEALDDTYRRHGRMAMIQEINAGTSLGEDAIKRLGAISQFRVFGKNHVLFRAGDKIDRLFVLKSGWAKLSNRSGMTVLPNAENGNGSGPKAAWKKQADDVFIGPSHCFGVDAITRDGSWEQTCTLMERSEVLEITLTKLRQNPELRETLLLAFSGIAVPQDLTEARKPVPVARAQEELIATGLVDATNLLVMDMDLCVRCGNCSMACHQIHGQSRLVRRGIHISRPTSIKPKSSFQSLLAPAVCLHCKDPECLTGCPTGAIGRFPDGQVDIDPKTCIGCTDCATQCPYNAISMIPRKGGIDPPQPQGWKRLLNISVDPLPPSVETTEDLVAVKCNLCAGTSLNPAGSKTQAYSCEENCPTGALLRVDPRTYFVEIRNIEGVIFRDSTHAIAKHTSHKDPGKRIGHAIGILTSILFTAVTWRGLQKYGFSTSLFPSMPLIGSWLDMRWLTGIVGLLAIVGVMAYPFRRQKYKKRLGALRYWLLSHAYLGVISSILLLLHGGIRSGGALTTALMISFDLVILTGLWGIACYYFAPRLLTKIEEQPLLIEDLLDRRGELTEELGSTLAAASPEARKLIEKHVIRRCSSLGFLFRQYFKRESLDQMISRVSREFEKSVPKIPAYEKGNFFSAVEKAATMRRVDALIYLHKSLKSWLAPHVVVTSLMLALMIVHIIQVVYFID
jgi:Fe-S-cluster-containing dehydrogenase component/CRP-like cAMP-binding protein